MATESATKRAIAFIDGQNLFHSVKESFGYTYPNYDPHALAKTVCLDRGWTLAEVRLYTGIPDSSDNPFWNHFWTAKLAQMGRQKVHVFSRPLRYRNKSFSLPDGIQHTILVGEEKGIDVRIAIDIIRLAHRNAYDVALVFSQDQDLSEVADEIRAISQEQGRWVKVASAFPSSITSRNRRGIDKTDWIMIDKTTYDCCLDNRDYRPKRP
ncbi:MAG: NYN domain-containing protein [Rhodospirillales bacterium RIFCSPLOWO2_12_FULL_58_28]|nr:MAG: NYN domain-containing protein [Rhodospirillales bacterium RIFCSPLOWO2_02_FULL_58_16]OHC78170.1 MAG: NYN domain-containing protein [Rhodospirillales bacterium RIFCSPLOWO2_12_FULL_58_28]